MYVRYTYFGRFLTNSSGHPDGQDYQIVVFKPKIPIWEILEGLGLENVLIFYDHLVHLCSFGIFYPV
jgi:hypothetical protein